jgi:glycerol kinase
MPGNLLLAIDQGTTSTRTILFGPDGRSRAAAQEELRQIFPQPGWVEHDPEEIWRATVSTLKRAMAFAQAKPADIAGIGITNQRETTILWDRATGKPIHNAIVWQDRRTAQWCQRMKAEIGDEKLGARTGLLFDAYFSGSKIAWLLDNVAGAREAAEAGRLAFGTIDSFLLWRLTGGKVHATDATNASRTMLFNIAEQRWDDELLKAFRIPKSLLPEVKDCAARFGETTADLLGAPVAITGIAGDQQAATIGQACFRPGMIKSTYGTGCFVLMNTGDTQVKSKNRLISTIAYRLGGRTTYALEGSIFVSGRRCSGCATRSRSSSRRPTPGPWRSRSRTMAASTWCRPSSAWVPHGGTRRRAARSSASPAIRASPISRARHSRPASTRPRT